ncbi:MAG: exodeoxyribonuclease large subunit, partial [Thermoplasmata archaeon]|nr:exodeoxyribonuclease large subunit [Thermoplasmata archaeon]
WYFDLKDETGVIHAAMFRQQNARVKFAPQEGMEVLARGAVGVYAKRSELQVVVRDLRPVGVGALALAFDQMRRRLEAEGLFAPERKRPLPRFPQRIGVVTSLSGAVLRDIVRTAKRRNPAARLLIADARVQGDEAAASLVAALRRLERADVDVIVVARGGGALENLWAFNEETLVRAVAACRVPIVSAVGHETDYTLCDFAADARASTPTAAAELLAPDAGALLDAIGEAESRLVRALEDLVPAFQQEVDDALSRMAKALSSRVGREADLLAQRAARLDALSPLAVLGRGYAIATREGKVLRSPADAPPGSRITVKLRDGDLPARVEER